MSILPIVARYITSPRPRPAAIYAVMGITAGAIAIRARRRIIKDEPPKEVTEECQFTEPYSANQAPN